MSLVACARHADTMTGLSCGRCGVPICARCMVASPVGTRCSGCTAPARSQDAAPPLLRFLPMRELAALAALGIAGVAIAVAFRDGDRHALTVRGIVYGGWIVTLVAHEFSHSIVAYIGGDKQIRERGLLTLNPIRYMDPVMSLIIPTILLMIGGLPLIGGRTFVDERALRSHWWSSAVSAAGPMANLACGAIIGVVFAMGLVDPMSSAGQGLAFLGLMQVISCLWNLLPFPYFDGFHLLAPHLPGSVVMRARSLGMFGLFLPYFVFLSIPGTGDWLWEEAYRVAESLDIPVWPAYLGGETARFSR
jgi:Zn-dependent protease